MKCRRMDVVLFASLVLVVQLFSPGEFEACSYSIIETNMPPSFIVFVRDRGQGLEGLTVKVTTQREEEEEAVVVEGTTDSDGSFRVQNLSPGVYDLNIGENTAFSHWRRVRVSPRHVYRVPETLDVEWVPEKALRLREFTGVLRSLPVNPYDDEEAEKAGPPVSNATFTVRDARSETILAEFGTDVEGRFRFPGLAAGLYIVTITVPYDFEFAGRKLPRVHEDRIPLEISAEEDAFPDPIELSITWTSCGVEHRARPVR